MNTNLYLKGVQKVRPLRFLGVYFILIGIVKLIIALVMLVRESEQED